MNEEVRHNAIKLLSRLDRICGLPDFVKQANLEECFQTTGLNGRQVIHSHGKSYPVHTKAATWLSAARFLDSTRELKPDDAKEALRPFLQRAVFFEIGSNVKQACMKILDAEVQEETEAPDHYYGFVSKEAGIRKLPLFNNQDVLSAVDWLKTHRGELTFKTASAIAERVLNRSREMKTAFLADDQDWIERLACQGISTAKIAAEQLKRRANCCGDPDAKRQLLGIVKGYESAKEPKLAFDEALKVACICDHFDREYETEFERPEDVLFQAGVTKFAQETRNQFPCSSGAVYRTDDLKIIKKADLQNVFGSDFVRETCSSFDVVPEKLGQRLRLLSREDGELFDKIAEESGVRPVFRGPGKRVGFTEEQLMALS